MIKKEGNCVDKITNINNKLNNNWNKFAEKGKTDKKIKDLINDINNKREKILEKIEIYYEKGNNIFTDNLSQFSLGFDKYLRDIMVKLLKNTDLLVESNVFKKFITEFKVELFDYLDKKINQNILCEITFRNGYSLFKLFEALEKINSRAIFKINSRNIEVFTINDSKTYLMKILLDVEDSRFSFFKYSELSINITDLVKIMKCNKSEEIITTLKFKENQINIELYSKTHKSKIARVLNDVEINLEKDNILYNLMKLNYSGQFILNKNKFFYLISQSGRYSEIIKLKLSNDYVCFSETSERGKGEIIWKKNLLPELDIIPNILENELIELKNKNSINDKKQIEKIQQEIIAITKYGIINYFSLENLKKITEFLFENKVLIQFNIRNKIPIKIKINFKSLDKSFGLFFLAQRDTNYFEE